MISYVLVDTTKSHCSSCFSSTQLLQRIDMKGDMFFICWNCKKVFQVGVGEVKKEEAKEFLGSLSITEESK